MASEKKSTKKQAVVDTTLRDRFRAQQARDLSAKLWEISKALGDERSQQKRDALCEVVAKLSSAFLGWDDARARRMRLLEALEEAVRQEEYASTLRAMARKANDIELTEKEKKLLTDRRTDVYEAAQGAARKLGLEPFLSMPDDDGSWGFAQRAKQVVAPSVSTEDAQTAVLIWGRHGRPRSTTRLPEKWKFLAGLASRLGLGKVGADSLSADWREWRKLKRRGD